MPVTARQCPSCSATLADEAAFCHKCGASTPHAIDRATGEIHGPTGPTGPIDPAHHARLQRALGDNCEIRRLLGRGGFAEVYVAFDRRLKREIAVKTIRSDVVSSEALRQRFQSEAEAVAALRHPNVIPIYSVGEADDLAYFTMPLIAGESLATCLEREGKLSVAEACRILREAAHALHAAHRAGIVHRDVKPENIMLEGPERSVVVMDFGIAKSMGAEGKGLTGTGMLVGTPEYMSPEQAMGERTLGHHSDQYSLALVGYRMLSGTLPFDGESLQTRLFKIMTEIPAPLSTLSPEIPKPISDAVAKALSKSTSDRFESMAEFAGAFDTLMVSEPSPRTARRRAPAMSARVAAMRSAVRPARMLVTVAGVALAAATWLKVRSLPDAALTIAAARSDAEFTARQFLANRVPGNRGTSYARFTNSDTVQRVVQRAVGFDSLQVRALRDVPVWAWSFTFPSPDRRDNWIVRVGGNNRITGFLHVVNDSAPGTSLSADSARALATRELSGRGWDVRALQLVGDSTITRRARTDHEFTWRTARGAIPLATRDTATLGIRIVVSGGAVSRYDERVLVPDSVSASMSGPSQTTSGMLGVGGFMIVLLVGAVAIRRQRVDTLQWVSIARLAAVVVVLQVASELLRTLSHHATAAPWEVAGSWVPAIVTSVGMLFLGVALTVLGVAGESLAAERRPESVAGLQDLSRGRLLIPEIVPATLRGYAIGALMLLVSGLSEFALRPLGVGVPRSIGLTDAFTGLPALSQLADALMTTAFCSLGVLLGTALVARITRVPSWLVVTLPAAFFALVFVATDSTNVAPEAFLCAVLGGYTVWRYGVLTGIVAIGCWAIVDSALPLIDADFAFFRVSGVLLILVALGPAVAAVRTWRKFGAGVAV